jgi:TetR/AcrR family transcriptional regulator, regulator of cefoperazone and chloramphenicol sensitivity
VVLRYFARSMLDGSPRADAMFAELVGLGERWLSDYFPGKIADPTAYAALLVAMELGALVMGAHLSQALGADIFSREGQLRLTRAKLDFYSKPLLSRQLARRAHEALDQLEQGQSRPARPARRGSP